MASFEEQGIPHWIDSNELNLQLPLQSQIREAICKAQFIALLDTPASRISRWVDFELRQAQQLGKKILSLRCPISIQLEQIVGPE